MEELGRGGAGARRSFVMKENVAGKLRRYTKTILHKHNPRLSSLSAELFLASPHQLHELNELNKPNGLITHHWLLSFKFVIPADPGSGPGQGPGIQRNGGSMF
jgi:hypothetical protein